MLRLKILFGNRFGMSTDRACAEHFALHHLRKNKDFIPGLAFVMEQNGRIIGQNVFVKAEISLDGGNTFPVLTMGPICIANDLKLSRHSLESRFSEFLEMPIFFNCKVNEIFYPICYTSFDCRTVMPTESLTLEE